MTKRFFAWLAVAMTATDALAAANDFARGAVIELPAGRGMLDIWAQPRGEPRPAIEGNSTLGDVELQRLDD